MVNWQLSKKAIHWPVSLDCSAGSSVQLIEKLKLSADQLLVFNDCGLRSKISHCQRNYVLWRQLHRQQFDFGSVNTTLNDLLCEDIENYFPCFLLCSF